MQLSWLVCFILSAVVGFLNPHIGLFAAITIIQALITAAFLFNIRKRLEAESAARQMGSQSAADAYRKSAEAQKKILFLAAIILALALTAAYALLWFMSAIVDEGTVTLAPIDTRALDPSFLEPKDIARLNDYHKKVREAVAPYLAGEELAWLLSATKEYRV